MDSRFRGNGHFRLSVFPRKRESTREPKAGNHSQNVPMHFDFVKTVFERVGVEEVFWKVPVKPGKPIFFGTKARRLVFGLPGNPASDLVTFYRFMRPALLSMMGRERTHPVHLPARTKSDVKKKTGRTDYLRAKLQSPNGKMYAELRGGQHSHMPSSFANAECLVAFPKDKASIAEGGKVQIQLLPWAAL